MLLLQLLTGSCGHASSLACTARHVKADTCHMLMPLAQQLLLHLDCDDVGMQVCNIEAPMSNVQPLYLL